MRHEPVTPNLRPAWLIRVGDALSQLANVLLLNGDANESISGRSHREGWRRAERAIDALFSPFEADHCRMAHLADVMRAELVVGATSKETAPEVGQETWK